jgi:plastocyanin
MLIKTIYTSKINYLLILSILISVIFLSGCTQQPVTPGENTVLIENLTFKPSRLTVENGTTVTWINNDAVDHTIVEDNELFSSGTLMNGQNFSYTFTTSGTYNYFCSIHPDMRGKIIVQ